MLTNRDIMKIKYVLRACAVSLTALLLASCGGNDTPYVSLDIRLAGGVEEKGVCTTTQDSVVRVRSITVNQSASETKGAMVSNATYYWDGFFMGRTIEEPFAWDFRMAGVTPGMHSLLVNNSVLAEDKAIGVYSTIIPVMVYPSGTKLSQPDSLTER